MHFWKVGIEKSWQMGTLKQHGVFFDLHSIFYSFIAILLYETLVHMTLIIIALQ